MDPLTAALFASLVGGPAALLVGLILFPWRYSSPRRRWPLVLLAPPLISLVWGIAFHVEPASRSDLPMWIAAVPWLSFLVAAVLTGVLPYSIGGRLRLSTFALSIAALAATIFASFGALMSITGDYI